jgi:hypothetical protein
MVMRYGRSPEGADFVVLADVTTLGFSLRLMQPRARLLDLARDATGPDGARLAGTRLRLALAGELEGSLALGAPQTPQLIRRILARWTQARGARTPSACRSARPLRTESARPRQRPAQAPRRRPSANPSLWRGMGCPGTGSVPRQAGFEVPVYCQPVTSFAAGGP